MKTLLLASPRMSTPKTEISLGRHPRGEKPAGASPGQPKPAFAIHQARGDLLEKR